MINDVPIDIVNELLTTATHLCNKHNQTNSDLRRAVSSAYYAIYHFIIIEAVNNFCKHLDINIKIKLCRNFEHHAIKDVCVAFREEINKYEAQEKLIEEEKKRNFEKQKRGKQTSVNLKPVIGKMLSQITLPIASELKNISVVFPMMQEARHRADYDLSLTINELETAVYISKVKDVIQSWHLSNNPDKHMFLLFIFGKIRH